MNWVNLIASPIVEGVLKGLREMRALRQFEEMQAEILEGWVFKIKIAIERELRAKNIPHDVYKQVIDAVDEVVKQEFDTRKL